jgi:uncharacterized protein YecT (DUF1311 family)
MRTLAVIWFGAVFLVQSAAAEDCSNMKTQIETTACANQALQTSEQLLDKVYARLADRVNGRVEASAALTAAEEAWIAFRNAECAFVASNSVGGSAYPMIVAQCRDGLTRARIATLSSYTECKEGDLTCPAPNK